LGTFRLDRHSVRVLSQKKFKKLFMREKEREIGPGDLNTPYLMIWIKLHLLALWKAYRPLLWHIRALAYLLCQNENNTVPHFTTCYKGVTLFQVETTKQH
jgi:hypothetical protein